MAVMPFVRIADLQMFYTADGAPDAPPLLLVHGAGATGESEWRTVRDALAKNFRVVAPDCRGHGKTRDPRREYTFALLANDLAQFLYALAIAPAFVVGHSNGGNAALVLTVEHPDVVKKVVVMAGNAYVSSDLLRYGRGQWSERVGEKWGKELAGLHDPADEPGYWRALMDRTGYEIARAPNYSPGDLQRVRTPAFVIQGANDSVNAPSHHAEFMAEHLANAQLWIAPDTGHSVHEEHPQEWVERVTKFFLG